MYENLLNLVAKLDSPRVLVAGDFMLDVYTYGDATRISPEAPVPVLWVRNSEHSCGGAGRVAENLAVLGAMPTCIGIVGEDNHADILKKLLTDAGCNVDPLQTVSDRPTITKQRLIGLAQHRHQQQLFRMDYEQTQACSEEVNQKILEAYKNSLNRSDLVCIQDHNKGMLSRDLCQNIIRMAKETGTKVLIDPCPSSDYEKYIGATLLTPNRAEASLVVGFDIQTAEDALRASEILLEKLQLDAVVITMDKQGAFLAVDTIRELIPTRVRNVYDVSGAGDMVLSSLAITLAAGIDYHSAVQLANVAGGLAVEKFGAVSVTIGEIQNELLSQQHEQTGKVQTIEPLKTQLDFCRQQKKKIVFTNGCFDILHRGHTEYLNFCKQHGDILVVGMNSDSSVREIKGPERPINNQEDRAAVLAALEMVDYVCIFDEPDPARIVEDVCPDVLVKGEDWKDKGVIGREFVEARGGKVVLAPLLDGRSSTNVINKMKSMEQNK